MTTRSASSAISTQGGYIKVSEFQTELVPTSPSKAGGWSAYWDSYAQEFIELPDQYEQQHDEVTGQ